MIGYFEYFILEGINPHVSLHIGLLADGNIHNIKIIYSGKFLITCLMTSTGGAFDFAISLL